MGLGKTVITCELINRKPVKTVILVPLSILEQWESELRRFTDNTISVIKYHGIKRKHQIPSLKQATVIVTTNRVFADEIEEPHFADIERLVIDEAHRLRNSKGKAYQQIKSFGKSIENKVFLTGTPICNSIQDVISLICLSNMEEYGAKHGQSPNKGSYWRGNMNLAKLQEILPSVLLRQTKNETKEVKKILPNKTIYETIIKIDEEEEMNEYDEHVEDEWILRRILRMRQSVNGVNNINSGKKLEEIRRIVTNVPKEDKIIIFSSLTGILKGIKDSLSDIQEISNSDIYHGKLLIEERNSIIQKFKTDSNSRVLLINLRCGGTGLNLVEANHVIIVEPYWNDSEQEQAINRIYRIGQKKDVYIHKLIAENSIEKWISLLQKSKLNISNYLIDKRKEYNMEEILNQREKTSQVYRKVGDIYIEQFEEKEIQEILDCDFHM